MKSAMIGFTHDMTLKQLFDLLLAGYKEQALPKRQTAKDIIGTSSDISGYSVKPIFLDPYRQIVGKVSKEGWEFEAIGILELRQSELIVRLIDFPDSEDMRRVSAEIRKLMPEITNGEVKAVIEGERGRPRKVQDTTSLYQKVAEEHLKLEVSRSRQKIVTEPDEPLKVKRPRGRPRKHPLPDPANKRPRGRPRKDASAS